MSPQPFTIGNVGGTPQHHATVTEGFVAINVKIALGIGSRAEEYNT